jgi:SAM-dependent methyltransferase
MTSPARTRAEQVFDEIHRGLQGEGTGRNRYTRRAWELLPPLEAPRILDLGCGPGGPTLELARLSGGRVIGLDHDPGCLRTLQARTARAGLADTISPVRATLYELPFPVGSFDLIWSEGSIWVIGFERGLREWSRYLRPGGFLAVHEGIWPGPDPPEEVRTYWARAYPAITTLERNLAVIRAGGFDLLGYFPLPEDAWWVAYYGPLEARLEVLEEKYREDREALAVIAAERREVELYRRHPAWFGSVFFVLGV